MAGGQNAFSGKPEGALIFDVKTFPGELCRSLEAHMGDGAWRAYPDERVSRFSTDSKMTWPPLKQIAGSSDQKVKTAIVNFLESQPIFSSATGSALRQISHQKLFDFVEKQFPKEKDVVKVRTAISFAIWSHQQQKEVKDAVPAPKMATRI